jgi:uncharacterized repeat protein (TIGR01451 family)
MAFQQLDAFALAAGDEILFGTSGNDNLSGGSGNDILDGLEGNDVLDGGDGNDNLSGGSGNDALTGKTGSDSFVFDSPTDGVDKIEDFKSSEGDRIVVSATGFDGGLTPDAVLKETQFVLGTTAADSEDRFIYDLATGNIFFDPDGIGNAPKQQIATLTGAPSLSASDIFVSGNSTTPTIKITAPATNVSGKEVTIQWNAFDADSEATISLFYDTDNQGFDGVLIADKLAETDGQGSFPWNTENIPQEDYFIYAKIVDEKNVPIFSYSKGQVQLKPAKESDLSVTQTANSTSVGVGESFTYTIQVINNGSVTSQGVTLVEMLPEEVTFVSANLTPSDQTDNSFTFALGDMAAGESRTIEISVTAPAFAETIASSAFVTSKTFDPNTTNDVADLFTEVITPELPDLVITRTDNTGSVNLGQQYTYTLTVINNGSSDATEVVLTEKLPSVLNLISRTLSQGNAFFDFFNQKLTANLGTIKSGQQAIINITVKPFAAGKLISTTNVLSNTNDLNPLDNQLVHRKTVNPTIPAAADIELTKTVNNPNPQVGNQVTFTLTLTNKGLGSASRIEVKDLLPKELTFISALPEQGSYNQTSGIWDVGNIRDNLSRTLQITAEVNSAGLITNIAEVTAVNESDPDSTPNNNNPNEDDIAFTTLTVPNENNVINGDDGNNTLRGTPNPDLINGLAGDDYIEGLAGDDSINGGTGNFDRMFGGIGNDSIDDPDGVLGAHGGIDNDTINVIFAASWDNDTNPNNSPRSDGKITGGDGNDTITVTMNNNKFFINLKGDEPKSNTPSDGNDVITLQGSYANSVVDLGGGDDTFKGGQGNDNVSAKAGNDILLGAGGGDRLSGGEGNDTLTGGDGRDIFVLAANQGTDFIVDFIDTQDTVGLANGLKFSDLTIGSNTSLSFHGILEREK